MAIKNNKGEWSEWYTFLKILDERKVFAADEKLEIIKDKFFIFHEIIRNEKGSSVKKYDLSQSETKVIITDAEGNFLKEFDKIFLKEKTLKIFEQIKKEKEASFSIPETNELMQELLCEKIKASNEKKADLVAVIDDRIANVRSRLGFSIKSMIGNPSTLLNAGKTTNFIYKISGFSGNIDETNQIETKNKIRDRIKNVLENNGVFEYIAVSNDQFNLNMKMIDTMLPEFIGHMLLNFFMGKSRFVEELTKLLSQHEDFKKKYALSLSGYSYKIKNFLAAVALGMVPSLPWDGFSQAYGGYIVVKENGDLVCYNLYNPDEFRSYLYENTCFDTSSSSRHEYGKLYEDNGDLFFKLNLQIRFLH